MNNLLHERMLNCTTVNYCKADHTSTRGVVSNGNCYFSAASRTRLRRPRVRASAATRPRWIPLIAVEPRASSQSHYHTRSDLLKDVGRAPPGLQEVRIFADGKGGKRIETSVMTQVRRNREAVMNAM